MEGCIFRKGAFRSVLAQGPSVPVLHGVLSNRDLPSPLRAAKSSSNRLYALGVSWTALANLSKEECPCLLLGCLSAGLCLSEPSVQMRKVTTYVDFYVDLNVYQGFLVNS